MDYIDRAALETAMDYRAYRALIDRKLAIGRTTGTNHSPAYLQYTNMNIVRMKRLDRTTRLLPETLRDLQGIQRPLIWLVLTEGWCGDAAQIIPVLQAMAQQTPRVELKLLLRDEQPDLMDAFLTEAGRSIPKLIVIDRVSRRVLGSWGPRPAEAQRMARDFKPYVRSLQGPEERKKASQKQAIAMQKWYARDKTRSTQREVLRVVKQKADQIFTSVG